jgi:hypothetical protein
MRTRTTKTYTILAAGFGGYDIDNIDVEVFIMTSLNYILYFVQLSILQYLKTCMSTLATKRC